MVEPDTNQQASSLNWVKDELNKSLDKARSDLEVYVEGGSTVDIELLQNCRLALRQVHDTLKMVQLEGASILVGEMSSLLDALIDSTSDKIEREVAFEALMRAMLQLPGYFARIQSGRADAAIIFLPLVNELRGAHGLDALLPESLFTPKFAGIQPELGTQSGQDLQSLIRDSRYKIHRGMLGLFRNKNVKQSLEPVISLFEQYCQAADSEMAQQIYWIGAAVAEAVCDEGLEQSMVSVRRMFGQIDRISKSIVDSGEEEFSVDASDNLIRMLLYYVATASSDGRRIGDIRTAFQLSEYLPHDGYLQRVREELGSLGMNVMETVTTGIIQELEYARNMLDIYNRTGEQDYDRLKDMVRALRDAAGAIVMIGHADLQEMMNDYCSKVEEFTADNSDSDAADLSGLPDLIVQVESRLYALLPRGHETTVTGSSVGMTDAILTVIKESAISMSNVKDTIAAFSESLTAERERLDTVNDLLQQIAGSLKIVSHLRASDIVYQIRDYINKELVLGGKELTDEEISSFADVISSVDYYLDAVMQGLPYREKALNLAERSLVSLGYQIRADHIVDAEQGVDDSGPITEAEEGLAALEAAGGGDSDLGALSDDLEFELSDMATDLETGLDVVVQELKEVEPVASTGSEEFLLEEDDSNMDFDALQDIELEGEGVEEVDEQVVDVEEIDVVPPVESEEAMMGRVQASLDSDSRLNVDGEIQVEDMEPLLEEIEVTSEVTLDSRETEEVFGEVKIGQDAQSGLQSGSLLGDDLDDEIIGIFLEEAEEVLDELKRCYPIWKSDVRNSDTLTIIRRSFHTLKGSGRMVGAIQIGEFSWALENLLNHVIDNTISTGSEVLRVVGEAIDILPEMIACLRGGSAPDTRYETISSDAGRLAAGKPRAASVTNQAQQPSSLPEEEAAEPPSPKSLNDGPPDSVDGPVPGGLLESDELRVIYTNETTAYLQTLYQFIARCKSGDGDCLFEDEQVRALHTLHGGLVTVGAYGIKEIFEVLEPLVVLLQEHGQAADEQLIALLQRSLDQVRHSLSAINGDEGPFLPAESLLNEVSSRYRECMELYGSSSIDRYQTALQRQDQSALEEISSSLEDLHSLIDDDTPAEVELPSPATVISDSLTETDQESQAESAMKIDSEPEPESRQKEEGERVDSEIMEIFVEEAAELLASMEMVLNDWQEEPDNMDHVIQLQRDTHTLKGGARMVDFSGISDLGHELENLLVSIADGHAKVTRQIFDVLFDVLDELQAMYEAIRESGQNILPEESSLKALETLRKGDLERLPEPLSGSGRNGEITPHTSALKADDSQVAPTDMSDADALGHDDDMSSATPEEMLSMTIDDPGETSLANIVAMAEKQASKSVDPGKNKRGQSQTAHESIRVRSDLIDNLVNLAGEASIFRSRLEQQSNTFRFSLSELSQTVTRLKNQLRQMEIETEAQILFRHERDNQLSGANDNFDPLEMDRYSQLQQLSKSLMESVGDLNSLQDILGDLSRDAELLLIQQGRVNTELQDRLMQARVVPFAATMASRLRRIVRQTCQQLGKKAEIKLIGANEEMDRRLLDRMASPLEHMLRNSIAHGIELPEVRAARGKPEAGTITVSVTRDGGEIIIQMADDGGGLDTAAIRKKAEDRELIVKNADMTDEDIMQLIVTPGFSIADEVSQIAGRGVGMDVVNNEIKRLGGLLKIESVIEQGTSITIRLPFTLAISQALLVGVANDLYAIPLSSIDGVSRVTHDRVNEMISSQDKFYQYGGEDYQMASLGRTLGRAVTVHDENMRPAIILVQASDHCVAFHVDEIIGHREIVVKSLGAQISSVNGMAGGTTLGDGRVALILDVPALVRMVAAAHGLPEIPKAELVQSPQRVGTRVMVVDDSITVRRVTTRLLERHDMEVVTAKDGVEATALLEEIVPDAMLLDIEMPHMDGYELATQMRNDERYKDIPILMITSRTGAKHRERAEAIGVDHYLGKPYQEVDLLAHVNQMLAEKRSAH